MSLNFPNSPTLNQTYSYGERTWKWNGTYWETANFTVGYTGSIGDIGYTGSQGDIGYTGSIGDIGYTGSQGPAGGQFIKTYFFEGTLTVATGDVRLIIHTNSTLKKIKTSVVSAGTTDAIIVLNKNGSSIQTVTIPANQSNVETSNLNISLLENDYITIDITQASSAEDLYVTLIYEV